MLGVKVVATKNFEKETIRDVEGDAIPKEKMLIFELADKTRIAVRGSGTEPKIKYYLFAQRSPNEGKFTTEELTGIKAEIQRHLESLWSWLQQDAQARIAR
jgi:phosphoglucomutase